MGRCFPTGLQIEVPKKKASCATSAVQEGVPSNGKEWNVGAGPNTPRHNATSYFTAGKIEDTRNSSLLLPIRHSDHTYTRNVQATRYFPHSFQAMFRLYILQGRLYPRHDVRNASPHYATATAETRAFRQLLSLVCAFEESRKSTISFVMCLSIRLSVRLRVAALFPLDGFQ